MICWTSFWIFNTNLKFDWIFPIEQTKRNDIGFEFEPTDFNKLTIERKQLAKTNSGEEKDKWKLGTSSMTFGRGDPTILQFYF